MQSDGNGQDNRPIFVTFRSEGVGIYSNNGPREHIRKRVKAVSFQGECVEMMSIYNGTASGERNEAFTQLRLLCCRPSFNIPPLTQ